MIDAWPDGRMVAVVFDIAYESWADGHGPALGPMGNPLPPGIVDTQGRSWGRYGHTSGIGRLQDILDRHGVRATAMVSGVLAEQAPDTLRRLHDAGHDLCAHGYSQEVLPGSLDAEAERAEIEHCTWLLASVTGGRPRGWMSPRCTPSLWTGALLAQAGYTWHGDAFDVDVPVIEEHPGGPLVAIPFHMEVNDLPVLMRYGHSPSSLVERFRTALDWSLAHAFVPIHLDVTAHAHVLGRAPSAWAYEAMIEIAAGNPAVWIATRSEIAELALAARSVATL